MPLVVDGSLLEGGGQILRISSVLAALFSKDLTIVKIRGGRSKPGLRPQHMHGLKLISEMSGCQLHNCLENSLEVSLDSFPKKAFSGGNFIADTKTAGSVSLLLQIALPFTLFSQKKSQLKLLGGTVADMAPPIHFTQSILHHYLKMMNVDFSVDVVKHGYYPRGGGEVIVEVEPLSDCLHPLILTQRGSVTRINIESYVAGVLPLKIAEEMSKVATSVLKASPIIDKSVEIIVQNSKETKSVGNASYIFMFAETSEGCRIASSAIGKKGTPNSKTGETAAMDLLKQLQHKGCVDENTQDQVLLYMLLARGRSSVLTGPLSSHSETVIAICQQILAAKFFVEKTENGAVISCDGIAYSTKCI